MHPNPVIQNILREASLNRSPNILMTPPLLYHDLVYLLDAVDGVTTDSGGIQEEAVSLNKPVLVLRKETDRPEALEEGSAILVGTREAEILEGIQKIMENSFKSPSSNRCLYGDGHASERIAVILQQLLKKNKPEYDKKHRILLGSPVRQNPAILKEFLSSLERLEQSAYTLDYFFVDDNLNEESSLQLSQFAQRHPNRCRIFSPEFTQEGLNQKPLNYWCDDKTHYWDTEVIWKVAAFKDKMISAAIARRYDYLFLIDSDLLMHPKTIDKLISDNKEIVSTIFWTRWFPSKPLRPQVWLSDHFKQYESGVLEELSNEEISVRKEAFYDQLRKPGCL